MPVDLTQQKLSEPDKHRKEVVEQDGVTQSSLKQNFHAQIENTPLLTECFVLPNHFLNLWQLILVIKKLFDLTTTSCEIMFTP